MHPLAPNLSDLSMDELLQKYNDLTKRLNQAYRYGPHGIVPQIQMMQAHYMNEMNERNTKQMEEMNRKSEESGKGYKGIIDIT